MVTKKVILNKVDKINSGTTYFYPQRGRIQVQKEGNVYATYKGSATSRKTFSDKRKLAEYLHKKKIKTIF